MVVKEHIIDGKVLTLKKVKKVKKLARKSALSSKAQEGNIIVVEDFVFDMLLLFLSFSWKETCFPR